MTRQSTDYWGNAPDPDSLADAARMHAWAAQILDDVADDVNTSGTATRVAMDGRYALDAEVDATVAGFVGATSATRTALDSRYATSADLGTTYVTRGTAALDYARAMFAASTLRPVYVAFAGDSYISGQDATRQSTRYVDRVASGLQAAYPCGGPAETPTTSLAATYAAPRITPGVHVVNGGVGATASADYLTPTTRGYINTLGAKIVFHIIGTNDLATTPPTDVAVYKANIAAHIAAMTGAIHILVHGALRPDAPWHDTTWAAYGQALAELAEASPATVGYLDMSAPFFAADMPGTDPLDLMTDAGIHPNDAGMALMAAETLRLLGIPGSVVRDWFITDTFTRSNVASITTGRTEFPGWHTWAALGSAVTSIASGKAVPTTVGVMSIDALRQDVEVSADVTKGGSLSGLVARCNDVSNYLLISLGAAATALYKVVAGTTTLLVSFAQAHTDGVEYQLRVVTKGNVVTVYENGRAVITHTLTGGDETTFATWTKVGLYSSGTATTKHDNFGVRPA